MRSFIAIEMESEAINSIRDQLRSANADIKFVEPGNLHLTLKFLGEIKDDLVDDIHNRMEESFKDFSRFEVQLRGVGVFPSLRYIKVVWVGIEENKEKLAKMQESLEDNISNLGFKKEGRFKPHLTIGRVKSPRNKDKLAEIITTMKDKEVDKIKVDRVILKKSVLTPKGPIYTTLREVML
ncbi:MAG: RNA 2',3'-cyclic phosphodiesterase [Candidatus Hydrothermarchaeales archaeon]